MIGKGSLYFIFSITFFLQIYDVNPDPAPTSGPFRSMILSVNDCVKPSRPYIEDPPLIFQTSIFNGTGKVMMLSGNLTVVKDIKNVKSKMKSFLRHDGKWELNYVINNIDCHGMLIHLISVATKVKYDRKNCMYLKGSYAYKNLDVNQIQHLWASTMEYGNLMWRVEVYTSAGTIFCKEFDTVVEPA